MGWAGVIVLGREKKTSTTTTTPPASLSPYDSRYRWRKHSQLWKHMRHVRISSFDSAKQNQRKQRTTAILSFTALPIPTETRSSYSLPSPSPCARDSASKVVSCAPFICPRIELSAIHFDRLVSNLGFRPLGIAPLGFSPLKFLPFSFLSCSLVQIWLLDCWAFVVNFELKQVSLFMVKIGLSLEVAAFFPL